ncbi:unnamed protein product [Victoria cruziana]
MEFEVHLSSYDHNHRKRFKEMREMHGSSSRDDRLKREQQREEREMAKYAQMADAQKQQQESSEVSSASAYSRNATSLSLQEQRQTLKFGFSSKAVTSKGSAKGGTAKKPKVAANVSSIFGHDSDEET